MSADEPNEAPTICTCGGRWPGVHAASCPQHDAEMDQRLRDDLEALTGRARRAPSPTPEGFTRLTLSVAGAGHHMAGHVTVLCCDDCGSLVGNTPAHRLLCFREERDGD